MSSSIHVDTFPCRMQYGDKEFVECTKLCNKRLGACVIMTGCGLIRYGKDAQWSVMTAAERRVLDCVSQRKMNDATVAANTIKWT
jgi:hypothetical protein